MFRPQLHLIPHLFFPRHLNFPIYSSENLSISLSDITFTLLSNRTSTTMASSNSPSKGPAEQNSEDNYQNYQDDSTSSGGYGGTSNSFSRSNQMGGDDSDRGGQFGKNSSSASQDNFESHKDRGRNSTGSSDQDYASGTSTPYSYEETGKGTEGSLDYSNSSGQEPPHNQGSSNSIGA